MAGIDGINGSLFNRISTIAPLDAPEGAPNSVMAPAGGSSSQNSGDRLQVAKKAVRYIMDHDAACDPNINKDAQAEKIARIALDVGVKPEVIGAIIKQETHFTTDPKKMNKGNGTGPMQMTRVTIHDMLIRPQVFDPDISKIVGSAKGCKYKTFEDALKAKYNNPSIDLGKFGNKFFEFYKQNKTFFDKKYYDSNVISYSKIPKAIKDKYESSLSNYDMNVYLGCYTYKAKSRNQSENQGIKNYNGSSLKEKYTKAVGDTIQNVRVAVPEIKRLNVKS